MNIKEFVDKLFSKAKEAGFTEYEVFYIDGDSFKVTIYKSEIDQYSINSHKGLSFRGLYNGKMGYSYTEVLDDYALEMLIKNARENALAIEDEDVDIIYGERDKYADIKGFNEELDQMKADEKIKMALELEKDTLAQCNKVKNIEDCMVVTVAGETRIINSKGLDLQYKSNVIYAVVAPVVEEDGKVNTAYAFKASNNYRDIDTKAIAKEAVEDALAYMGAESIPSGKYKVIIRNDVMADILSTFAGIFSAYNVQKGMSLLKGKVGTKIASEVVTIIDDPLMENGLASAPFDSEGVACYTKTVVEEGKLNTFLYNLKTAKKDGVKSTGNASKGSYASAVGVSPSNFYIKPSNKTREDLMAHMGDGIFITEVQGLHSGANPMSGDFSLAAKGFEIKNGKIIKAVEQITVAGNFYNVLQDIVEVGGDIKFGMPAGGYFGSPSVVVRELAIAGK
ncbi:TldD/PmbA family protein [Lutispora thermophila]|uniref:PmbA protein n=1 Tax=Lutispora thermophila DSM 19022 TaxID=1122184 RepID=A0A1M6IHR9_9FIRM|nr:TldD/PmbA family protein [Lutispora thermophila]SHJ33977.1 PmbA protein [Lutispora thermophila DSM 19022]